MRLQLLFACIALATGLLACETTVNGRHVVDPKDAAKEASEVSPFVAERIERTIRDVPYLKGKQVMEASADIVRIGTPAIPKLLEALADSDPTRRVFAINVLGVIGDRRVLPNVRARLDDPDTSVRYEAARASAHLGDWVGLPVLIAGMSDSSEYARTLCHDSLRRLTHLDFGYNPKDSIEERDKAIEKWREWWAEHSKATLAARS